MATSLEKVKIGLVLNEPFFASVALKLEYTPDESTPTMCTNGRNIRYSTKWFNSIKPEERKGVLAHEVMHIILLHHLRIKERDVQLWNVACDHVVNLLLKKQGFQFPGKPYMDDQYEGLTAEQVYERLQQQQQQQKGKGKGDNQGDGIGDVEQPPKDVDPMEMEQEAKQMAVEAVNAAKQAGKLQGFMKELVQGLLEPKQPWKELLQRFVSQISKNDYSWVRPNPRYFASGMYLPSLYSEDISGIVFAIDTSASISQKMLVEFVSEIREACTLFKIPVTVIQCDTKVQHVCEMSEDEVSIKLHGRGGTAFQPVFDYVTENLPDTRALVYFTDGDAFDDYQEPPYPVLWAIYESRHFKAKFGEVIIVEP